MSSVSSVSSSTSSDSSTSEALSLSMDDFYTLLITEIENQDPTDPVDNKDLVLQLAQFSTFESTIELNESMSSYIESAQLSSAATLIGMTVSYLDSDSNTCTGTVSSVVNLDGGYGVELSDGTDVELSSIISATPTTTSTTTTE